MSTGQLETKGFFGALFDFGFTSFITLRFLKVIYAILVALICLTGLIFFVALLFRGAAGVVLAVVLVPLVTLLYLVIARVYMEVIALFFRIGENTSLIAATLAGPSGPAGGAPGWAAGGPAGGPSGWGAGGPATGYPGPSSPPASPAGPATTV